MSSTDLGTYSIPATGTPAPTIPSLVFDVPAEGYLEILVSGPGTGHWYDSFGFSDRAVQVFSGGRSADIGSNSGVGFGYDHEISAVGAGRTTFLPVSELEFSFNQEAAAYVAQLILHVTNDAKIIGIVP